LFGSDISWANLIQSPKDVWRYSEILLENNYVLAWAAFVCIVLIAGHGCIIL